MSLEQQVKAAGFVSIAELVNLLGKNENGHPLVPRQTLRNWYYNKSKLLELVILGGAVLRETELSTSNQL